MDTPQAPVQQDTTNVINPQGQLVAIPSDQVQDAANQGYRIPGPAESQEIHNQDIYGTPKQQFIAGLEGAASGVLPFSETIESGLGLATPEQIQGRAEANPWTHGLGAVGGFGASALSGVGLGSLVGKVGELGAGLVGLAPKAASEASALYTIGSHAVKGLVEGALLGSENSVDRLFAEGAPDKQNAIGSAIGDIGYSTLLGAAGGGAGGLAFGLLPAGWEGLKGTQIGAALKGIGDAVGKTASSVKNSFQELLDQTGVELTPEIRARLSSDPNIVQMGRDLEQHDTGQGKTYQEAMSDARGVLQNKIANEFGTTGARAKTMAGSAVSSADAGHELGNLMADAFEQKIAPAVELFENADTSIPMKPDVTVKGGFDASDPYLPPKELPDTKIPGTGSQITARLLGLAQDNQVLNDGSPSDLFIKRAIKLVNAKTDIGGLDDAVSMLNKAAKANPDVWGVSGDVAKIIRGTRNDLVYEALSQDASSDEIQKLQNARELYSQAGDLKDLLTKYVGGKTSTIGGKYASFGAYLRELAQDQPEKLISAASRKGNSVFLDTLQNEMPEAAQRLKKFYTDSLFSKAALPEGKPGYFSTQKALNAVRQMSPELQDFLLSRSNKEMVAGLSVLHNALENTETYNTSNTARTLLNATGSNIGKILGSVIGAGHGGWMGGLAGSTLGAMLDPFIKEFQDGARLGALKFIGSNGEISAPAFRGVGKLYNLVASGDSKINKAVAGLLGGERLELARQTSDVGKRLFGLDKRVQELDGKPEQILNASVGSMYKYAPGLSQEMARHAAGAVKYINSQRPQSQKRMPLDAETPVSSAQNAAYQRTLQIADNPMLIVQKMSDGTLTHKDVADIQNIAPGFRSVLSKKLMEAMTDKINRGETIPAGLKNGIALVLGYPLQSNQTPQGIMAAQPQNQPAMTSNDKEQARMKEIGDFYKSFSTPAQHREEAKQIRK